MYGLLILTALAGWLTDCDTTLLLAVNGSRSEFLDTFMWLVSGKWEWIPLYASILYVVFRSFGWRVALACILAVAVVFLLTDAFSTQVLRPLIGRLRPSNPDNPVSVWVQIVDGHRGGRFGFPSAHASNAWGLAFFCSWLFRRNVLTVFMVAWALLMCYSRVYLGVHYPGDLAAGTLLGLLSAWAVGHVFVRISGIKDFRELKYSYLPVATGTAILIVFLVISVFVRV